MSEQDESLIQYPCMFPIKAMGESSCDLVDILFNTVKPHDPKLTKEHIKSKASSKGRYISVTLQINAVSREQLDDIYRSITALDEVIVAF